MKIVRKSYILFFFTSIIIFYSIEVSPNDFWLAGALSFGILPCLLINLLFSLYFIFRKHYKTLILSIILFGVGHSHITRTFNVHLKQTKGSIKVINSNVRIFNVYKHLRNEENKSSKEMINWISNNDADILILQEYYNNDKNEIWNTTSKIKNNFKFHYLKTSLTNKANAEFGQMIFSKYPIVKTGIIPYENKTFNQATYADIKINTDTIRVYNIHLQSMAIEEEKLFDNKNDEKELKKKVKSTSEKLIRGFKFRTKQIEKIVDHIKSSPYPVILGADMNDLPYSYAYNEFSKLLKNSYEEKGNGFGFTFNGKLFFLRIDNLFASNDFETNSFNVNREITHSDHFPITATYTLKK